MNPPSSPQFPSSFDPAIHLHSELADDACAAPSYSDDFVEIRSHIQDVTARKSKEGVVIQHRAWKTPDVFRSDEDYPIDTPAKRVPVLSSKLSGTQSVDDVPVPSSPPTGTMARSSSPVTYPATSSPTATDSPRKRRKLDGGRSPLKAVHGNARVGGFFEADTDDEDDLPSTLFHKARPTIVVPDARSPPPAEPEPLEQDVLSPVKKLPGTENLTDSAYASDIQEPHDLVGDLGLDPGAEPPRGQSHPLKINTCSGRSVYIGERRRAPVASYEQLIAARSEAVEGQARRAYYGIDIHQLMDDAAHEASVAAQNTSVPEVAVRQSVEQPRYADPSGKKNRTLMWSEKYRARKFTDLIGDERTHRSVLRWLKSWDQIVFPGAGKPKPKANKFGAEDNEERTHRKILLLTGPPGLGKTTLAHVCAKQAGYEVQEINASDERSRDVVRSRIRDMVGTENVRGTDVKTGDGKVRKAGRPVCVVVDEVDGVVGGSGGSGEGGFVKALIDLVMLDQKNSSVAAAASSGPKRKTKGDKFRLLRPLILICNDVYHPSLRPLRQSSFAEIIHIRKPALNMVVSRMHAIFEKEGVPSDTDGIRRLCEATWGVSNRKEGGSGNGTGEGDIRSVMVVGEWVATKLRSCASPHQLECPRLTRRWFEEHILTDLAHGGGAARSLGRGGAKEVVDRVFKEGAGFPKVNILATSEKLVPGLEGTGTGVIGVAEGNKRRAMARLREMIDTSGETERIVTDCFTTYPTQTIQDDTFLTKPNAAYEWLHFHDSLSSQLTSSQDWELAPYLSSPILGFHHLFASSTASRQSYSTSGNNFNKEDEKDQPIQPFSGPSAPFTAAETLKANTASITVLQSSLSLPLARMYRSPAEIATELLPYILRMLSPDVKPVVINSNTSSASGAKSAPTASVRKASEKQLVARAVECMAATGVRFEKSRVEQEHRGASGGWVYRMEPALDSLAAFETMKEGKEGVRYAVRQVLEQEWRKENLRRGEEARKRRMGGVDDEEEVEDRNKDKKNELRAKEKGVKRDFFGREIKTVVPAARNGDDAGATGTGKQKCANTEKAERGRVWISFREGYSNAVRKPVTLKELMDGL